MADFIKLKSCLRCVKNMNGQNGAKRFRFRVDMVGKILQFGILKQRKHSHTARPHHRNRIQPLQGVVCIDAASLIYLRDACQKAGLQWSGSGSACAYTTMPRSWPRANESRRTSTYANIHMQVFTRIFRASAHMPAARMEYGAHRIARQPPPPVGSHASHHHQADRTPCVYAHIIVWWHCTPCSFSTRGSLRR